MSLVNELAVMAMEGGGRLSDEVSASDARAAAEATLPQVQLDRRRVLPALEPVWVEGRFPVRSADGFRPASEQEVLGLRDDLVGGTHELADSGSSMDGVDPVAGDRLAVLGHGRSLEEQGLVTKEGNWTMGGELLLGSGLFPCVVETFGSPLDEVRRVGLCSDTRWEVSDTWTTLVEALPVDLAGFGGDAPLPALTELVAQLLVVALAHRNLAPEYADVPLRVRMTPREVEAEVPGGALRWVPRDRQGPVEEAHRNPRVARWLRVCCRDYSGAPGLALRAASQGFRLIWSEVAGVLRVRLRREPARQVRPRRSQKEVTEGLVLGGLRAAGGEASAAFLRAHTDLPNSSQQDAINRLLAKGIVGKRKPGAKPQGQTYFLCAPEVVP